MSPHLEQKLCSKFLGLTSGDSLAKGTCGVCWELHFSNDLDKLKVSKNGYFDKLEILRNKSSESESAKSASKGMEAKGQWCEKANFTFTECLDHLNGLPLLNESLYETDGDWWLPVCHTCRNSINRRTIPPCSVANNLWIGPRTDEMKKLNIPTKLLVCPVRGKAWIVKLKGYGSFASRQRGIKGNTIAFPQTNHVHELEQSLPQNPSVLSKYLQVIFVGSDQPTEKQLEKVFKVSVQKVVTVLNQFRLNGHPAFQQKDWNNESLEAIRTISSNVSDTLRTCSEIVSDATEQVVEDQTQSYLVDETDYDSDDYEDEDDLVLGKLGVINGNAVDSDKIASDKIVGDQLVADHLSTPVTEYNNPEYWVNSFPWLFPYGTGGPETDRPNRRLNLREWVSHLLRLKDPRFRNDPAFIFFAFNVLQKRKILSKTKVLFKSICRSDDQVSTVNNPSIDDFKKAMECLNDTDSKNDRSKIPRNIKELQSKIRFVGGNVEGSIFERGQCRDEIYGMITELGLPHLFLTLNPSDINTPIVSYWHYLQTDKAFDLDTLLPDFPSQGARAQMVADDPVTSAEFFHVTIRSFLKAFLGFDSSITDPTGVSGPLYNETIFTGENSRGLKGFYGPVEMQGRGSLHLHILIWLHGPPQPAEFSKKLQSVRDILKTYGQGSNKDRETRSSAWFKKVSEWTEHIICNDFPKPGGVPLSDDLDPVDPRPVLSKRPSYYQNTLDTDSDEKTMKEELIRDLVDVVMKTNNHKCRAVCFKYGSRTCRFNYPRPLCEKCTIHNGGFLTLKRSDHNCNPYTRGIISCLRCNMDISLITNGLNAKARIMYISDYVTKMELSAYEAMSLMSLALEKIETYKRKGLSNLTQSENDAMRRIYTILNTLDSYVERSGQWVASCLMKWPLVYKSHSFVTLPVFKFVSWVESCLHNTPMEVNLTVTVNNGVVVLTGHLVDYEHRTEIQTNRFLVIENENNSLSPEHLLAQISPYEYIQSVSKVTFSGKLKQGHVRFAKSHPQFETHCQKLNFWINPKLPKRIPSFYGYALPSFESDPVKYSLMILSVLSPYKTPQDIFSGSSCRDPVAVWETYLNFIKENNQVRYKWLQNILSNMSAIKEGNEQAKLEKAKLKEMKSDQQLEDEVTLDSTLPGYDYDPDDLFDKTNVPVDNHNFDSQISYLPAFGPCRGKSKIYGMSSKIIKSYSILERFDSSDVGSLNLDEQLVSFEEQLSQARAKLYKEPEVGPGSKPIPDPNFFWKLMEKHEHDEDQSDALISIASHILKLELFNKGKIKTEPCQMMFYIGGEGGTGKSAVVDTLTKYLSALNIRHKLRMGAWTGVAADNIGGSTISHLLGLTVNRKKSKKPSKVCERVETGFKTTEILLIDEISFISCEKYQLISDKLCEAKGNYDKPFGGVTLIVCGDLYQLKPIGETPLYTVPTSESTKNLTNAMKGYTKWTDLTHCVFLKTQYRIKDEKHRSFIKRFRHGNCIDSDKEYLKSKVVTGDNVDIDDVIIVNSNKKRYDLNFLMAYRFAEAKKRKLLFCVAHDTCKDDMTQYMKTKALLLPETKRVHYVAGILPLVEGLPVIIKKNLGTELGICNGTRGVITKIVVDHREKIDYNSSTPHYLRYHPVCVHVKINRGPDKPSFQLPGLDENVFPFTTRSTSKSLVGGTVSWTYVHGSEKTKFGISRRNLCILPAFAMTIHSSQGCSLHQMCGDLSCDFECSQKPYVILSRVTDGSRFKVLGSVHESLCDLKPNQNMVNHIEHVLQPIEQRTKQSIPDLKNEIDALHALLFENYTDGL